MKKMDKEVIIPFDQTEEYYIELNGFNRKIAYEVLKRCLDIIFSMVALLILILPMCVIAIAIKCTSEGAVLYTHDRLSKNGKPFKIIKFRTMIDDAEKDCIQWSGKDDPRVTRLGVYLRRYHIDELPQLINVLKGDMSIVGPRPERPYYVNLYNETVPNYNLRHSIKSGITGLSHIYGDYYTSPNNRLVYDLLYIYNFSILLDIKIILKTLVVIIKFK
jgi:lipopolysaccharide/colanic/teichoic acid biosynthesis glycosyltransferase